MNEKEILERLEKIVKNLLGRKDICLTKKTSLHDLGVSSFSLIQVVCAIEEEFNISISNSDIAKLNSIASLIKYINKKTK